VLLIRDNGRGMEPDAIARRAVALGILTAEETEALDGEGKQALIFREGFTTRDRAGLISGRGLGLALAARCVRDADGAMAVSSVAGYGTVFTLELPALK